MGDYYDSLFNLCGFENEEIEDERPRIDASFKKLGIGPSDMQTAESRVRKYHDVSLEGVRKLLGAWLKELIDLVLAKEEGKKIVYYGFPAILGPGLMLSASSGDVFISAPDMVLDHTMGQIFDKLGPILEAGEANGLPSGHGLCSLWQAKIGGIVKGMIPVPDLALASSYYCDMGSKADDLVTALYGVPIAYIDGVMDSKWGEFPRYLQERVHYLGARIDQSLEKAGKTLEIDIAPDAWEKSRESSRPFRENLARLAEVMNADPVPLSLADLELLEALSGSSTGRGIRAGIRAMDILISELEERVRAGRGVTEKGAPRVMVRLGHTSDPRVSRLFEEAGLAVPLTYILASRGGVKVDSGETYETPGEIIAEYEMTGGYYHGTEAQIRLYERAAELMSLDGFVAQYLYNCRPVATISHIQKRYLEEKTGLPVLSLEIDNFDSRAYSADSMRTKVETFAEMLKDKKRGAP